MYNTAPNFVRPELLTHPNIPKPLHGLNPRAILGKDWWDKHRKEAYWENNNCCWACGVHKSMDYFRHNWLEGHESYKFDYSIGALELQEIVALCPTCHKFIHSGRSWMVYQQRTGELSLDDLRYVIEYGMHVLDTAGLDPFWGTKLIQLRLKGYLDHTSAVMMKSLLERQHDPEDPVIPWKRWHIIIDGIPYYSMFEDEVAWAEHYGNHSED